jgi:hypothetical protein
MFQRGNKKVDLAGGAAMTQKVLGSIDKTADKTAKTPLVERAPIDLSKKVVEELISLVEKIEDPAEAGERTRAGYWSYRAPFPGVRYYSWE